MAKLIEFKKALKKEKINTAIFFGSDSTIKYFTSFDGFACLMIPAKKSPKLFVPDLEYTRAKETSKIKPTKWKNDIYKYIKEIAKNSTLGIDKEKISANQYQRIKKQLSKNKIKDISKIIVNLRKIKTEEEINNLKIACKKTDEIIKDAINQLKSNKLKTETEVASYLISETIKQGLEIAFDPIIASGENSKHPHYKPKDTRLKQGFCVIDFGVKYKNYCSDMTRTIYIGTPSKEEISLYNKVLIAQKTAIDKAKPNKSCSKLHQDAEKLLNQKMIHALGHGIGIDVHEAPSINSKSKDILKRNMVIAIEPGIYNKQGIRIEDTVLIKEKAMPLTITPKTLISIKKP
ncbi:Xaa-Pro peptidase family protein [Candidatus Woesearchaeota archaeon]|jgi:Xaa-Pro aminopeptidase|nr:Xaa-Pro peptidase family protein [Candidatus Woesearchaeota archaeon]